MRRNTSNSRLWEKTRSLRRSFKDVFMGRFFLLSVHLAKAQEFTDLVQGSIKEALEEILFNQFGFESSYTSSLLEHNNY
jgi:hypothetical protein